VIIHASYRVEFSGLLIDDVSRVAGFSAPLLENFLRGRLLCDRLASPAGVGELVSSPLFGQRA